MSSKVVATALASLSKRRLRRPGVSMMQAPLGVTCKERVVVVWRPRLSPTRLAPVSCVDVPNKVLVSVLLPVPLEPTSTRVWPSPNQGASEVKASSLRALTASATTPMGSMASTSSRRS